MFELQQGIHGTRADGPRAQQNEPRQQYYTQPEYASREHNYGNMRQGNQRDNVEDRRNFPRDNRDDRRHGYSRESRDNWDNGRGYDRGQGRREWRDESRGWQNDLSYRR